MDSKIILTIIIVAVIGVVAATYQTDTGSLMNTLTSVGTEDTPSISDEVQSPNTGASQSGVAVEENIVTSSSPNGNNPTSHTPRRSNGHVSSDSVVTSTGGSPSQSGGSSGQSNGQNSGNNANGQIPVTFNPKISSTQALAIAQQALPPNLRNAQSQIFLTEDVNGVPYYYISATESGEVIAEYEINGNTGAVTGGAVKGETPTPQNNTQNNNNNNHNSSQSSNQHQNSSN